MDSCDPPAELVFTPRSSWSHIGWGHQAQISTVMQCHCVFAPAFPLCGPEVHCYSFSFRSLVPGVRNPNSWRSWFSIRMRCNFNITYLLKGRFFPVWKLGSTEFKWQLQMCIMCACESEEIIVYTVAASHPLPSLTSKLFKFINTLILLVEVSGFAVWASVSLSGAGALLTSLELQVLSISENRAKSILYPGWFGHLIQKALDMCTETAF